MKNYPYPVHRENDINTEYEKEEKITSQPKTFSDNVFINDLGSVRGCDITSDNSLYSGKSNVYVNDYPMQMMSSPIKENEGCVKTGSPNVFASQMDKCKKE